MSYGKKLPLHTTLIIALTVIITISVLSAWIAVWKKHTNAAIEPLKNPTHQSNNVSAKEINLAELTPSFETNSSSEKPSINDFQNVISEDNPSKRFPVKIKGKKTLHLKLLTRPFSKIYKEPNPDRVKFEKVDTFRIYYAYTTPEQTPGFYEIGTDARGTTIGFMKQDDVIEWKQYLTLMFTNKEDKRTLFFRSVGDLQKMMYSKNRTKEVRDVRRRIQEISKGSSIPDDFPVIAVEPAEWVNIYEKPYLLPILHSNQLKFADETTRILQVASAVKDERKPETNHERIYLEGTSKPSSSAELIATFKADVVFVIDTTISMQPYIDGTISAVQRMAGAISDLAGNVSFGLVAYRDDPDRVPGLEYRTKVFCNLEDGMDVEKFIEKTSFVRAATVSSVGYDEDVWAGIYTAMKDRQNLKRRDGATLFIIQIGDAGAHDYPGTVFNADSISQIAEDEAGKGRNRSWIFSVHLKTSEAKKAKNVSKAARQFRRVTSKLPGEQFYHPIDAGSPAVFESQLTALIRTFVEAFKTTKSGKLPGRPVQAHQSRDAKESRLDKAARAAIRAAVLEYVGTKKTASGDVTSPPRDIQAWTIDRDLDDPETRPMSVMLMITRNDLDKLRSSMRILLRAGSSGEFRSSEDFFDQLQSIVTSAIREPDMISKGIKPGNLTLGKMGILPEFIKGLPYETRVVSMSMKDLSAGGEQEVFLDYVRSKLAQYEEYYKENSRWIELNEGDREGDHVTFLEIDRLP